MATSNITVTANTSTISVNETTNTVSVTATPTTVTVGAASEVSNASIRASISVNDTGGDGSLSYSSLNGVFTYTGPSAAETRAHLSATSPVAFNSSTGKISIDSAALFTGKTTDNLAQGSTNKYFTNATANTWFATQSTSNLSEGSNKYFTDARVNTRLAASGVTIGGDSIIQGNLNVLGNVDQTHVNDLYVKNNEIIMNSNASVDTNVSIIVNRPQAGANTSIRWNEQVDKWQFTNNGSAFYPLPTSTSDLAEGTNLYFTNPRAVSAMTGNVTIGNLTVSGKTVTQGNIVMANNTFISSAVDGGSITFGNPNTGSNPVDKANVRVNVDLGQGHDTMPADGFPNSYFAVGHAAGAARKLWGFPPALLVETNTSFGGDGQGNVYIDVGGHGPNTDGNFAVRSNETNVFSIIPTVGNNNIDVLFDGTNIPGGSFKIKGLTANINGLRIDSLPITNTMLFKAANNSLRGSTLTYDSSGDTFTYGSGANITINGSVLQQGSQLYTATGTEFRTAYLSAYELRNHKDRSYASMIKFSAANVIQLQKETTSGTNITTTANIQGAYVKGNGSELSGLSTTQVAEGNKLYYTTARANSAIADYKGTIATGNTIVGTTITGTTVTATVSAKTNKIEPNSGNDLDLYDVNKLKYNADKQNIHWNTGNVTQIGSVLRQTTGSLVFYNSEAVTTGSTNQGLIGSTNVGGAMATRLQAWNGGSTGGVRGIGGEAVMKAGSNVVSLSGLQTLVTNGSNFSYLGLYSATPRSTVDLATVFSPNMALKFSNTSLASFDGPFPKGTVISSIANSSATGGIANVVMSNNAETTTTFTLGSALDAFGVYHTVRDTSTGDYRFLSGVSGEGLITMTSNSLKSTGPNDFATEGTAELGANYFQRFTSTSLSNINGSITATDFTKANLSVANSPNLIEHENGFHRFKNTIMVGDKSDTSSRNLHTDSNPGFGLNIQWSGLGDTAVYGSTVQPAMTFSNFTDGSLQSSSGFEDKAGPRIMLGSFNGNKENNWTDWYPRQGQELGKYAWYSSSGDAAGLSTTVPPAAITAIASHNWDVSSNVSLDIIHYAQNKTANDQIAFLKHAEDTSIGASSGKQVKIGQGGAIGSDVRTSSNLAATHLTVDATETELFNRLQLYSRTTTEINALGSPQAGQVVYNSTLNQICVYNGSAWQKLTQSAM